MNNLEELFGGTIVGFLEIKMHRSGMMSIGGTITDEATCMAMLDTAKATLKANFKANREGKIIVPADDTALVGTPMEKKLLKATGELIEATEKVGVVLKG